MSTINELLDRSYAVKWKVSVTSHNGTARRFGRSESRIELPIDKCLLRQPRPVSSDKTVWQRLVVSLSLPWLQTVLHTVKCVRVFVCVT